MPQVIYDSSSENALWIFLLVTVTLSLYSGDYR